MSRLLITATIAACGITLSIFFTVQLLLITFTLPLAVAVGVLLGAGQFYATARPATWARNALVTVLFALSITATALQLEKTASADMQRLNADKTQAITLALTATDTYQLQKAAIASIDQEIASLQRSIDADIDTRYRSRANEMRKELAPLRAKRTKLIHDLTSTRAPQLAQTPHLYDAVSDRYRQLVLVLIAVMIEGVTAMGLTDYLRLRASRLHALRVELAAYATRVAASGTPCTTKVTPYKTATSGQGAAHVAAVLQQVMLHASGDVVSARKISQNLALTQRQVAGSLALLELQGEITKGTGRWIKT